MTVTNSWVAYSEKIFKKALAADDVLVKSQGRSLPPPKPRYEKGDTTAASARIAELRKIERLALKVDPSLITAIDEQAARLRPRFMAVVEGISARPAQPALAAPRPTERMPIVALIEPKDSAFLTLAMSPAATAVVAVCGCRWPIGEPSSNLFHFCNKKRAVHFYCEAHARKALK